MSCPTIRIRSAVAGGLATAALLLATSSASAATQRYASPTGSGDFCTAAAPCAITKAIGGASTGDEVIVEPGDYSLSATLVTPSYITVHGVAGEPRPRLLFSGAGQAGLEVLQSNLRYLEVHQAADATALSADVAGIDQAVVTGAGSNAVAEVLSGTIRNSVVVASEPGATAISTWEIGGATVAGIYRNVTAIAPAGVAISADAGLGGSATIIAKNVIAFGAHSVNAAVNGGGYASVTTTYSDLAGAPSTSGGSNATIATAGGDISGSPAFVNPIAGDYREAPGSPTIDAGKNDSLNGPLDFEGDPRTIGTTDIGADEFVVAPAVSTGPASAVSSQTATLTGTVNPNGDPTTYRFEYGRTTDYGSATTTTASGAGSGPMTVSASVAGLSPSTTYHYRLSAINAGGVVRGADRTFTTAAPYRFAGVTFASRTLTLSGRYVKATLRCPAGTAIRCTGQAKLTARHRGAGSRRAYTVKLGQASFAITAGKQLTVSVRMSRHSLVLFDGVRRLSAHVTVGAHDGAGQSRTTTATVTVKHRLARR